MAEEPECQLRRRRYSGNPNLELNLEGLIASFEILLITIMAEEPECQLRRRRYSGNPNLELNLEGGYQITEGNPDEGTPSPSKPFPGSSKRPSSAQLLDFKNKQQSFDIHIIHVEECEEEEIIVDSDDEGEENLASGIERAVTPTPIQDFGANTVYTEGPQKSDFLRVKTIENDCYTDVSDADTEDEE